MENEVVNLMLDKLQRDTARDEFQQLVDQGRKFCFYALGSGGVAAVVENFNCYFLLTYNFNMAESMQFVRSMNKRLGVDVKEEARIVSSSFAADSGRRK